MASQQVNRRLIAMVVVTALLQTALLCAAVLGPGGMEASRPRLETELEASRPRLETELEASRPRLETRPDSDAASGLWRAVLPTTAVALTLASWGVVAWVLYRVLARQREVVRLQRRFVADISHELKTPLALIRMLAETLRDGRIRDGRRTHEYHATITREAERLSNLLENILDYSAIESGQKRYDFAECDMGEVVRQAWTLFHPQFDADGFDTELEIEPDLPTVHGDAATLGQMMINLLQNAHRYSTESKFVRLAVTREPEAIAITLEDHGIGMSRAQVQRLGDSFYRAPDPRVRKTRGTGLGHAIVKHIVAAHGGKLGVYSHPNLGSTFVVRLPVARREPEAGPNRA